MKMSAQNLSVILSGKTVLDNISMAIPTNKVTALIGPSGCGKSSLLRSFNRMNELLDDTSTSGQVLLDGLDIYRPGLDLAELRRRVGIVFQKPNPFPLSIYENVAFGLRLQGVTRARQLDELVEDALIKAALWQEVKER